MFNVFKDNVPNVNFLLQTDKPIVIKVVMNRMSLPVKI